MQTPRHLVPPPMGKLLSRLPAFPGSLLFVRGLNLTLARLLTPDVTHLLLAKKLRIRVTDIPWEFDFEWLDGRFSACGNSGAADLKISASAYDFVLLARRQEDPDTLFFSRRLSMEGDTELGLLVKNTMDAIELPMLDLSQLYPLQVLQRMEARLSRP
jgi:predicted lipid carrier protein YhbT